MGPLPLSGRRARVRQEMPVRPSVVSALALVAVVAYVGWFVWALEHGDYNAWGTLLIAPALVAVSVPMLRGAMRQEKDPRVAKLILTAFVLKLGAAFVNHGIAFVVYGGIADGRGYHGQGVRHAAAFRSGQFVIFDHPEMGRRFINALTGGLYTVIGPSKLGGYLFFSWLAFWGLYLCYRAFALAVPEGDRRRYALLVFFLPSILFWSSAIGKEAWMTLTLGISAFGAAKLLTREPGGLVLLSLGLAGCALCRPHVAFMAFVAAVAGYLLRRTPGSSRLSPLATVAGFVVLLGVGSLLAGQFSRHFGLTSLSVAGFQSTLESAERESAIGRSAFTTGDLPWPVAGPSILVRPFPFEAHNLQTLLSSIEGSAMLLLVVLSWRRIGAALRRIFANPYLTFAIVYTILFLLAFSTFRNFGLLARERVQVFPFVLILLAFPPKAQVGKVVQFRPRPLDALLSSPGNRPVSRPL